MDFLTLFIIVCIINSLFYFFDVIFKSCSHYPYLRFLQRSGLNIGFFKIAWFTTAFNRTLFSLSSLKPKFFQKWFNIGVIVTVVLIPTSLYFLAKGTINVLINDETGDNDVVLEPMIPGLSLPISDTGYYFVTVALCSIVHEMGHAVAAFNEGVQVHGVGLIVVFLVPAAYVRINSEQFSVLSPKQQLRICCAGIWHNIILSALAYLLLGLIPFLVSPLYELGRGVSVTNLSENSKIIGKSGILIGDKLVAINDCEVSNQKTWKQCLLSFSNKPSPGYCVSEDTIHQLDESISMTVSEGGIVECCDNSSGAHLCFETLEDDTPLQVLQYSCLPVRPVAAETAYMCGSPKDCPPGLHCVRPVTPRGKTLLRIQRSSGNVVIFIGIPKNLFLTVDVSNYVQIFSIFPSEFPEILIHLTKYIIVVSSGLAFMNSIPCFYFDGHHISYSLVNYLIHGRFKCKNYFALTMNIFGMVLLIVNALYLLWQLVSDNL